MVCPRNKIIMEFDLKENFDFPGFLAAARLAGVKLEKATPEEVIDGIVYCVGSIMTVTLVTDTPEIRQIITAKVAEYNV